MDDAKVPSVLLVALWLCAAGCLESPPGDDDDAADDDAADDDAGDDDAGEDCDRYDTYGFFAVWTTSEHGSADGGYYDGVNPMLLDELMAEGDCALYGWEAVPFCDPPCESPLSCGFGNECRPWPEAHSVGSVSVSDPGGVLVELQETEYHYYLSPEPLPALYAPGTTLTLTASGGPDIAGFQRTVEGVDPWPTGSLSETIVQGEDMLVEWEPGTVPGAQVRVHMDIDHHAMLAASLECVSDDVEGQVLVPQALVDALIASGHSGIGTYVENAYIDRFVADVGAHDPGCVSFTSVSHRIMHVETVLTE